VRRPQSRPIERERLRASYLVFGSLDVSLRPQAIDGVPGPIRTARLAANESTTGQNW
jgi:hypothetical protein